MLRPCNFSGATGAFAQNASQYDKSLRFEETLIIATHSRLLNGTGGGDKIVVGYQDFLLSLRGAGRIRTASESLLAAGMSFNIVMGQ